MKSDLADGSTSKHETQVDAFLSKDTEWMNAMSLEGCSYFQSDGAVR